MRARKALLPDAPRIRELIALYSGDGTLIPRELPEICENIRDFTVVEEEGAGILACGALHLYGTNLSEVRSIAVDPLQKGKGAGRVLVTALLDEAGQHQVTCVCLFTRVPQFFAKMGFALARHEELPEKIFKDCVKCPRLHACDEIAMVRGRPQPDLRLRARLSPLVMPVRLAR
jgi:amino-acid N-acetyltransferase